MVLIAVAATVFVALLRYFVFVPLFGFDVPFMVFLLAVLLAAWGGGLGSGLLTTALAAAAAAYCVSNSTGADAMGHDGTGSGVTGLLIGTVGLPGRIAPFVTLGVLTSLGFEALHSARRRLAVGQRELAERRQQLESEIAERKKVEVAERDHREQLANEVERRGKAEMALREREERMRMAVETADIGTWDFNPITGERNWSPRAKQMFGLDPDADVNNVSYLDRLHPDDRDRAYQAVQEALNPAGNGRYEIEVRLVLPDQRIGWFVVKGQAFFQGDPPNRRPARFIGAVREITERKLAEQALRQAEDKFRKLATYAPVGIFHTDEFGRCLFVNETWCEIAGATPEQATGNGWIKFLHPEDGPRVVKEWRETAKLQINQSAEFRFANPKRGARWVMASATPLLNDAGQATGYVGTIVDITDRKAVEDVIRAERARLRSILDNTPAVISLKDLAGCYVLVNRGWEELYGVRNDQIVGRTNYDLLGMTQSSHMSQEIADRFKIVDRQVIESGRPLEIEDPAPYGDDNKIFVTVKFPITDESAVITGIGGISADITERRRAVDSLKAEQELLRRTIEMQDEERQLIAYQIHDGLIQYAAGALMQLDSLRSDGMPHNSALTVQSVVRVLRLAVEEGRQLMNGIRTPVLDDLGVVAALEHLIDEEDRAHVQVVFVKPTDLERMDPKLEEAIYRITQEALTNIRKHSRANSVRIQLDQCDDRVKLEVRDWGVGFSPTGVVNGATSGYGLKGMAERARIAGGTFQVESAPGDGVRLLVDLPYRLRPEIEE